MVLIIHSIEFVRVIALTHVYGSKRLRFSVHYRKTKKKFLEQKKNISKCVLIGLYLFILPEMQHIGMLQPVTTRIVHTTIITIKQSVAFNNYQ